MWPNIRKKNLGVVLIINSQQSLMFQYTDIILDNARSLYISLSQLTFEGTLQKICLSASMLIYFLILALASKIESLLGPK